MTDALSLSEIELFHDLTDEELEFVAERCQQRLLEHEELLFRQGSPGRSLFIVLAGQIKLMHTDHLTGKGQEISSLYPGSHLGEMSLFESHPRSLNAVAHGRTVVLQLKKTDLEQIIEEQPKLAAKLYRALAAEIARRLRDRTQDLAEARLKLPPGC